MRRNPETLPPSAGATQADPGGRQALVVARTRGAGTVETEIETGGGSHWEEALSTEHPAYSGDPLAHGWSLDLRIFEFLRPGAVVLGARPATMEHCLEEGAD